MMTIKNYEGFQVWTIRLSLVTTLIVVLLSWFNAIKLFDIIVRAGVSFGVMFLLLTGTLRLFAKTAFPEPESDQPSSAQGSGGLIDFSVGEDEDELLKPTIEDKRFPGQVDKDLSDWLPDSKKQAEIVRRMGWGDE
jgi:hypothetical protein